MSAKWLRKHEYKLQVLLLSASVLLCATACSGGTQTGESSSTALQASSPIASAAATPTQASAQAEQLCLEQIDNAPELDTAQLVKLEGKTVYLCDVSAEEDGSRSVGLSSFTVPDLEAELAVTSENYDKRVEQGFAQSLPYDATIVQGCMDDSDLVPGAQRALIAGENMWKTRYISCDFNFTDG